MLRSATAIWEGGPDSGEGLITTATGAINNLLFLPRYTPASGTETCTTPGELLAAAEAASVARWLARELANERVRAHRLRATATVAAEDTPEGYVIKSIHIELVADMEPHDLKLLKLAAERARVDAPVSRALNVPVTVEAKLEAVMVAA